MTSKTIIISALQDNSARGILTLFQEDDLLKCRLRTYNLSPLSKFCKLGIYHNNEVFSANLIEKNGVYESSFVGSFNMENDFYVALIDVGNNNEVLLAGGTYQGFYFSDNSVFLEHENFLNKVNNLQKEKILETNNRVEKCEDCDKCAKCKYKEFFYSQQTESVISDALLEKAQATTITENLTLKNIDNQENLVTNSLADDEIDAKKDSENQNVDIKKVEKAILPQIEKLFSEYEENIELNSLISNSKFVKVEENGENYSIGAIYESDNIKYICYAIKRDYNINPPKEIGENFQWLPIDPDDPLSVGYYVVFQDAKDLKIVKI